MKFKILLISFLIIILSLPAVNAQAQSNNSASYEEDQSEVKIEYPAVDALEKKVFGSAYTDQDIYIRLNKLENSVFGKIATDSLSERVERLTEAVSGTRQSLDTRLNNNTVLGENYKEFGTFDNSNSAEYSITLFDLEKQFLGSVYPSDSLDVRVTRLENKVFSESSEEYSMEERIQRLSAYADASNPDDFFEDQAQAQKYNNIITGAKFLFMMLQFFL
ncbi:MAG TPA: hypothetical protein P5556_05435 [Candidatus Gastranaerophilales bacterium]|nr:hypothetical protein [Candidatus Gastranaerophilales bacterium]